MATITPPENPKANSRLIEAFNDIRAAHRAAMRQTETASFYRVVAPTDTKYNPSNALHAPVDAAFQMEMT